MKMTKDMTQGNPISLILKFSIPLILGNLFQQLYNMVDTIIVGRALGLNSLTAVAATTSLNFLIVGFVLGVCSGLAIPVAQRFGAGDYKKMRNYVANAAYVAIAMALVITVVTTGCCHVILRWMKTPESIFAESYAYFWVICLGIPFTFLYNTVSGIIRALGDSRTPFYFLVISTILNIVLDLWFVAGLGWGIRGAAAATVIAQGLSAVLCFRYLRRMLPELLFRREDARLDRALLKKSLSFGLLSALHQSSLYIGKLLVQGAVNSMGTGMIAAYTATTRIEGFANSFGDSGAAAVSLFVAQNVGNRDGKRAREGFRKGFALLAVMGVALSVILYVTAYGGVVLMTGETGGTVVENGAAYMRLIAWFYVLCFVGNAFVGWFRGLGMVNIPVIGTCLHISIRVVLSWLLIGRMGLAGVALATGVGWVCVVTFQTLTWRFSRRQRAILNHV